MSDELGKYIGQYQIIEFIARGDTSFVYKGFQPGMNRYVAVKILPPSSARDANAVRQFQRQAELMAKLEHRNILPVYDSGQEGALSYVVSRFAEGGTLEEHMPRYRVPETALEIIEPITEALDFLHGQGVIYGNLMPSNVLIDEQNQPLLTDISLEPRVEEPSSSNVYLSPEQRQGGQVDPRSDVYALGVLLYEMVIGEAVEVGTVPSPRLKRPDLSTNVEKVILKAMAQYPDQRFQTAGEFSDAFKKVLEAATEPVQPIEPELLGVEAEPEILEFPAPEVEDKKDERWILIALGGLALVIILCAIGASLLFVLARNYGQEAAAVPMATAKVDANVFAGPSPDYNIVGVMQQGQSARVVGVSPDSLWWNIIFPTAPDGRGWVPAAAVVAQGADNVPVVMPTATSTIDSPPLETATFVPTELPPTLMPTEVPPTLAPTDLPPTLVPIPTLVTAQPYPPIETEVPPTSYPPPETEVPPLPTIEPPLVTIPPPPTDGPTPTEAPPTPAEDPGTDVGGSLCGLPALAAVVILFGLVWPTRRYRLRR